MNPMNALLILAMAVWPAEQMNGGDQYASWLRESFSACGSNPWEILHDNPLLRENKKSFNLGQSAPATPAEWDWRNVSGVSYVTRTLNQHIPRYCGSCWAHAASSSYSDRLKISRGAVWPDIEISVQYALNCLTDAGTCMGGSDLSLYSLFKSHGVPDESCEVYVARDQKCNPKNQCRNCFGPPGAGHCFPQPRYLIYRARDFGYIENPDVVPKARADGSLKTSNHTEWMVAKMKEEIQKGGPISCVVDAEVMFDYWVPQGSPPGQKPVIIDAPGKEINHVISVAGWGLNAENLEYWIVRNSWGSYWGDNGWAYIATGQNNAFIESFCSFVTPEWPPELIDHTESSTESEEASEITILAM